MEPHSIKIILTNFKNWIENPTTQHPSSFFITDSLIESYIAWLTTKKECNSEINCNCTKDLEYE